MKNTGRPGGSRHPFPKQQRRGRTASFRAASRRKTKKERYAAIEAAKKVPAAATPATPSAPAAPKKKTAQAKSPAFRKKMSETMKKAWAKRKEGKAD